MSLALALAMTGAMAPQASAKNAVTDAGPQDYTQVHQTHEGLEWQAQQKQDSQKQNGHSKARRAAGGVIGGTAGNAARHLEGEKLMQMSQVLQHPAGLFSGWGEAPLVS